MQKKKSSLSDKNNDVLWIIVFFFVQLIRRATIVIIVYSTLLIMCRICLIFGIHLSILSVIRSSCINIALIYFITYLLKLTHCAAHTKGFTKSTTVPPMAAGVTRQAL